MEQTYNQYSIAVNSITNFPTLNVDVYVSQSPSAITVFSNIGKPGNFLRIFLKFNYFILFICEFNTKIINFIIVFFNFF